MLSFLIVWAIVSVAGSRLPAGPVLHVHLRHVASGTEVRLDEGAWQTLDGDSLDEAVAARAEKEKSLRGVITAGPWVPHAHVVRTIDAFMKAGVTDLRFDGVQERSKD